MVKPNIELNSQKRIKSEKNWRHGSKSVVRINEQCCIWKNNGKIDK